MAGKGRNTINNRVVSSNVPGETRSASAVEGCEAQQALQRTPLQRMRELLSSRTSDNGTREISTVDDLREYLKANPNPGRILLRMKLLWVSDHQHKQLNFARLHFIDADSPKPLGELLETFRDHYAENARDVGSLLFTATAWSISSQDGNLPSPGTIVRISSYSNLGLFREVQCRATIRVATLASL